MRLPARAIRRASASSKYSSYGAAIAALSQAFTKNGCLELNSEMNSISAAKPVELRMNYVIDASAFR
ncbi:MULTISPECIES: hypothetical protein [Alphaproteobacteria]|jgi:hypothetical protein|uniref:hypothetical protein n=1 Tax=Alphaproteobacteria TaxID=28211 RepID=UPI0011A3F7CE|nr:MULTISPECIES: hypothetical protein [Sphingomonadaceae]|tara:strand:- start:149 stop:349 length:201 start_codon:yes stop_codon:yes gene_type:complete